MSLKKLTVVFAGILITSEVALLPAQSMVEPTNVQRASPRNAPPVAMILEVRGMVQAADGSTTDGKEAGGELMKPVRRMQMLRAGDRLAATSDGFVKIVFLKNSCKPWACCPSGPRARG
jgi:hypothetical protein